MVAKPHEGLSDNVFTNVLGIRARAQLLTARRQSGVISASPALYLASYVTGGTRSDSLVLTRAEAQQLLVLLTRAWTDLNTAGRTLYFFSSDSAGAYIGAADLKRGATRKVVTFDEPGREFTRGPFDTDGTRFFFTIAHHQADIWVADVELR